MILFCCMSLNCKLSLAFVLQPEDLFVCDSNGNDVDTPPPRLVEAYLDCQIAYQTQGGWGFRKCHGYFWVDLLVTSVTQHSYYIRWPLFVLGQAVELFRLWLSHWLSLMVMSSFKFCCYPTHTTVARNWRRVSALHCSWLHTRWEVGILPSSTLHSPLLSPPSSNSTSSGFFSTSTFSDKLSLPPSPPLPLLLHTFPLSPPLPTFLLFFPVPRSWGSDSHPL